MNLAITRAFVRQLLESPFGRGEWTLQGLGMLRLYLAPQIRLHVWSVAHAVPNVSELHTHPWRFSSHIIAGQLIDAHMVEMPHGLPYMRQALRCGAAGGLEGEPAQVTLVYGLRKLYTAGMEYYLPANAIHASIPEDGTVSIIQRWPTDHPDHANVYWQCGTSWVSAEPRRATPDEIQAITAKALALHFKND